MTFAERVKRIDIDVSRRSSRLGFEEKAVPSIGDSGSFFHDELISLSQVNISEPYRSYCSRVEPLCRTLAQVLHHRSALVQESLQTLGDSDAQLAWPSVLRLIAVLARDIREDFVDFVQPLIEVLAIRVDPRDPEIAGEAFRSLSFVFKFLGKALIDRADSMWPSFRTLLSSKREYVREFAAQSLGYLLRKMSESRAIELLQSWIGGESIPSQGGAMLYDKGSAGSASTSADETKEIALKETQRADVKDDEVEEARAVRSGLSHVVLEVVRSVRHQLTSKGPRLLGALLQWLEDLASGKASCNCLSGNEPSISLPEAQPNQLVTAALASQVVLQGMGRVRLYLRGEHLVSTIGMLCKCAERAASALAATSKGSTSIGAQHVALGLRLHCARMLTAVRQCSEEKSGRSRKQYRDALVLVGETIGAVAKSVRSSGDSFLVASWIRLLEATAPALAGVSGSVETRDAARRARAAIDVAARSNPYEYVDTDDSQSDSESGPETGGEPRSSRGSGGGSAEDAIDSDSEISEDDEETLAIQALSARLSADKSSSQVSMASLLGDATSMREAAAAGGNLAADLAQEAKRFCKRLRYGSMLTKLLRCLWKLTDAHASMGLVAGSKPDRNTTWAMGLSTSDALAATAPKPPQLPAEALAALKTEMIPASNTGRAIEHSLGIAGILQSRAVDVARCCAATCNLVSVGVHSRAHSTRKRLYLFAVFSAFEKVAESLRGGTAAWTLQILASCQLHMYATVSGFVVPSLDQLVVADSRTSATSRGRMHIPALGLLTHSGVLRLGYRLSDLESLKSQLPSGNTWGAVSAIWQIAELVSSSEQLTCDERLHSSLGAEFKSVVEALIPRLEAQTAAPSTIQRSTPWADAIDAHASIMLFRLAAFGHLFAAVLQSCKTVGGVPLRADARAVHIARLDRCLQVLRELIRVVGLIAGGFAFASRCNFCDVLAENSLAKDNSAVLETACFSVLHAAARTAVQARSIREDLMEASSDALVEEKKTGATVQRATTSIEDILGQDKLEHLVGAHGTSMARLLGSPERGIRLCMLQLLSSFEQPPAVMSEMQDDEDSDEAETESSRCEALALCASIERVAPSIVTERGMSNTARHVERLLLLERVPKCIYPLVLEYVVSGLQFIRYSPVNEVAAKITINVCRKFQLSTWPAMSRLLRLLHTCRSVSGRTPPSLMPDTTGDPKIFQASAEVLSQVLLKHGTMPFAATDPALFGLDSSADASAKRAVASSSTADKMRGEASVAGVEAAQVAAIGVGDHRLAQDTVLQVLGSLAGAPPLARKYADCVVALLFSHCSTHYYDHRTRVDPDSALLNIPALVRQLQSVQPTGAEVAQDKRTHGEAAAEFAKFADTLSPGWQAMIQSRPPIEKRHATTRLASMLAVVTQIGERLPSALQRSVEALCTRLLIKGEGGVAAAALETLCSMGLPHIVRCKELLESLLDAKKWRRAMAGADVEPSGESLPEDTRRRSVPAIARIAVGHLLQYKRGGAARERPEARRATVLQFFAKLDSAELLPALQILFRRYFKSDAFQSMYPCMDGDLDEWVAQTGDVYAPSFDSVQLQLDTGSETPAQLVGSLDIVRDMLRIMGTTTERYLPMLFAFVLMTLKDSDEATQSSAESAGSSKSKQPASGSARGQISQRAYLCLAELFKQYQWTDLSEYVPVMASSVAGAISSLPWSCLSAEKSPAVLSLLASIGSGSRHRVHLVDMKGSIQFLIDSVSAGLPGSKYVLRGDSVSNGVKPVVIGDILSVVHDLLLPEAKFIGHLVGDAPDVKQVDMAAFLDGDQQDSAAGKGDTWMLSKDEFVLLPHYFSLLEALRCRWSARRGYDGHNDEVAATERLQGWTGVYPNASTVRSMRKRAAGGLAAHVSKEFSIVSMVASCCVAIKTNDDASSGGTSLKDLRQIAFPDDKSQDLATVAADRLFALMLPYVDLQAHTTPTRYRQRSLLPRSDDDPIGPDDRRVASFGMLQKLASISSPSVAASGLRAVILTLAAGPNESRSSSREHCLGLMRAICETALPPSRASRMSKLFSTADSGSTSQQVQMHLGDDEMSQLSSGIEGLELSNAESIIVAWEGEVQKRQSVEAVDLAMVASTTSYYLGDENFAVRTRSQTVLLRLAKLLGTLDAGTLSEKGTFRIEPPFATIVGEQRPGLLLGASVMAYCLLPAMRHVANVAPGHVLREAIDANVTVLGGYFATLPDAASREDLRVTDELPPAFELIDGTSTGDGASISVSLGDLLYHGLLKLQSAETVDGSQETDPQPSNLLVGVCSLNGMDSSVAMEQLAEALNDDSAECMTKMQKARVVRHFVVPVAIQLAQRTGSAGAVRGAGKVRQLALSALYYAIGAVLPWEQYGWLLRLLLRNMQAGSFGSMQRCICAILDAFHFNTGAKAAQLALVGHEGGANASVAAAEHISSVWLEDAERRVNAAIDGGMPEPDASVVLVTLEEDILPALQRLLANREGMVNVEVAVACAKLVKLLPPAVLNKWLWGLLTKVSLAMKNRIQQARNSSRAAMVRIATTIGTEYLPSVIRALRQTLRDGYMVHVLGHVVYDVLLALHGDLKEAVSASRDGAAGDGGSASMRDGDADDVEIERGSDMTPLVRALPDLLEVVIEDVLGKVAMAKDPECGYVPKYPMAESRSCRGFLTFELVAGCIPFLPHPAVYQLIAPLLASLADGGVTDQKTLAAVVRLFSSMISGLTANTSVDGDALNQFCIGLLQDNLFVDGIVARDGNQLQGDIAAVRFSDLLDVSRRQGQSATLRWRLQRMNSQPLWSATDPYMLIRAIQSRAAGSGVADTKADGVGAPGQRSSVPLGGASKSRNTVAADVAAVLLPTSRPEGTFQIAAEPRMTGIGRYIKATEKLTAADRARKPIHGASTSSLDGKSAEVLVWFAMALVMSGARKSKISMHAKGSGTVSKELADYAMRSLLVLRSDRALAAGLQLITMMLQRAPRLLASSGKHVQQTLLLHLSRVVRPVTGSSGVDASTGARGQVSQQTVKAVTAMLRYLSTVKVTADELKAIVLVLDADLEVPERQNSTFALLRAVLHRRLVAPELYDLMDRVAKFMIRSTKVGARAQSAHVFLTFLMHFPLGEERLADHLRFFLRNLEYDKPGGRLAALDVVAAAIDQLPVAVLDKHAELLFLPLAARIVNDIEEKCRAAAGLAVSRLIARVPARRAQAFGKMIAAWTRSKQASPNRRLGFHLAGIMIEVRASAYNSSASERVGKSIVSEIRRALSSAAVSSSSGNSTHVHVVETAVSSEFEADAKAIHRMAQLVESGSEKASIRDNGAAAGSGKVTERERLRALLMEAMDSDGFIRATPGLDIPADIDVDLIEEVQAKKEREAKLLPIELSMGDDDDNEEATGSKASQWATSLEFDSVAGGESGQGGGVSAAAMDWQPVYYACIAIEKMARSSMPAFQEAMLSLELPGRGSSAATEAAGSRDDDDRAVVAMEVLAELLRFPHVWVRQVATRLTGAFIVLADLPAMLSELRDSNTCTSAAAESPAAAALTDAGACGRLAYGLLAQLYWLGTSREHAGAVLQVVLALSVLHYEVAAAELRGSSARAASAGVPVSVAGLLPETVARRVLKLQTKASLPVRSCLLDFFVGLSQAVGVGFSSFEDVAAEALAKAMGLGGQPPSPPPTASMLESRGISGVALDEANAMEQEEKRCGGRESLVASLAQHAGEVQKVLEESLPTGRMAELLQGASARRADARAEKRSRRSLASLMDPVAAAKGKRTKQEAGRRKKKRELDERRDAEGRSRKRQRAGGSSLAGAGKAGS